MQTATTLGLDIAKSVLQVHRVDLPARRVARFAISKEDNATTSRRI
jgi:hypothetical protein